MADIAEPIDFDHHPALNGTGLRGWTLPLSPGGKAALFPPPPWDYSAELLVIDFEADADRVATYLPTGLQPTENGACSFGFGTWCSSCENDARMFDDPGRGQHSEAYLLIHATRNGAPVGFLAYAWVTSELSQVRGLVQGFPKKLGSVSISRAVEVGRGGPHRAPGHRFAAHVSSMDRRLATGAVLLDRKEDPDFVPPAASRPHVYIRLFPSLSTPEPAVLELSTLNVDNIEIGSVYSGQASLTFEPSEYDELYEIGPITVGRGYLYTYAMTILDGTTSVLSSGSGQAQ